MNLYKKYSELDEKIKTLTEERDAIKETILEDLNETKETEYGKFVLGYRKTFSYSDKVEALSEKLKIAKINEEEKNIATVKSITKYFTFKPTN